MIDQNGHVASGWAVAVRQRRAVVMSRVSVGISSALASAPLLGWPLALTWGLAYMAMQMFELAVFAPINSYQTETMGRTRNILGCLTMSANTGLFGFLAMLLWQYGGVAGGVAAAISLPAAMIYSAINSPRSFTVLACTVMPQILYLSAFPFLLLNAGASPAAAMTAAAGGAIFSAYCIAAWRSLADRQRNELREQIANAKRIREMNRALASQRAFLAAISHDLRTPIGAILTGASELSSLDGQNRRQAELISDAGLMMKALLDDLLDHAKIEAGRMKVESNDFNLRQMLAQTVRLWRSAADQKQLRLRVEGAATIPGPVRGDEIRLKQVLNNLLSNAMKFTVEGSVTLRLNAWTEEPSGYSVLIEVEDTGPGMRQEQLARLFTPFDQTEDGVSARYGGTGLGLAISRDLVELMGGRLTARSTPGAGARFTISLFLAKGANSASVAKPALNESRMAVARPLAPAPAALTSEAQVPVAAPTPPAAPVVNLVTPAVEAATATASPPAENPSPAEEEQPLRLLVVDDHDINRRAVQLILEPLGCDIVTAADGQIALDRCAEAAFDVIFMDVRMPELDGRETTRRLRAGNGPNARTPVVAVTADSMPEDIAACQAAGMAYFVSKPLTPAALIGALQHVLADAASAADEARPADAEVA